jgi:hypothetical protein
VFRRLARIHGSSKANFVSGRKAYDIVAQLREVAEDLDEFEPEFFSRFEERWKIAMELWLSADELDFPTAYIAGV